MVEHKLSVADVGFEHSLPKPYHLKRIGSCLRFCSYTLANQRSTLCKVGCLWKWNSEQLALRPEVFFFEAVKSFASAFLTAASMASAVAIRLC